MIQDLGVSGRQRDYVGNKLRAEVTILTNVLPIARAFEPLHSP